MNNELYHHGIKNQRWGHRRFQNEDGTYTKAGLERYFGKNKTDSKQEKFERRLKKGKSLSKIGSSGFTIMASTFGSMAGNHYSNKLLKDITSSYLDSRAATWISNNGKSEIPLSAVSRKVLSVGEIAVDAYILGKSYDNYKSLKTYENRKNTKNKNGFEKYKENTGRKDV